MKKNDIRFRHFIYRHQAKLLLCFLLMWNAKPDTKTTMF